MVAVPARGGARGERGTRRRRSHPRVALRGAHERPHRRRARASRPRHDLRPERDPAVRDPERVRRAAHRADATAHGELPLARGVGERLRDRIVHGRARERDEAGPACLPPPPHRRSAPAAGRGAGRRAERLRRRAGRASRPWDRVHDLSRHVRRAGGRGRGLARWRRAPGSRLVCRRSGRGAQPRWRAQSGRRRDPAVGVLDAPRGAAPS